MSIFMNKSILVAGDVCDDIYLFSFEMKTNPEHSSPIYKVSSKFVRPGMAANVEANLKNMTVNSELFGNSHKNSRIQKTRLYYNDQYINRIDYDVYEPMLSKEDLTLNIKHNIPNYDAVIVSDYGKGFWNKETLAALQDCKKLVFIDPYSSTQLELYPECYAITPNYEEGKALTGEFSYPRICEVIANKVNCKYVILKVGDKGSFLYQKGWNSPILFPAVPTDCIDPCGAGDTFISALVSHFVQHKNITDAITVANAAAALTVQHIGVYSPTQEEWKNINEKV